MNKTAVCILMNMSNKCQSIPKGQFKMDNPEKLATQDTQDENNKIETQLNVCSTPIYPKQTQIKEVRHEPSYKQMEIKTN